MNSLFLVVTPHTDNLPPLMDADGVVGIQSVIDGVLCGGWWIAPETEAPMPHTTAVVIDSTDEKMDVFAAMPNLFFLKDMPDAEII